MKALRFRNTFAIGLIFLLGACSFSKTKNDAENEAPPTSSSAGTDPVPLSSTENPQPVDPSAPGNMTQATSAVDGVLIDYTVEKGDTLMKIAFNTYGDLYRWKSIYEANKDKIPDVNRLSAGTVLKVEKPAAPVSLEQDGEKYMIQPGDTLGKIANNVYGNQSRWKEIWEKNKQLIHNPNKIFAGFFVYYTPSTSAAQQESETSAASTSAVAQPATSSEASASAETRSASADSTINLPPALAGTGAAADK
jgi:LysM repeat protein